MTDPKGTFNYTIDQGHVFFAHQIPDGTYHVVATDRHVQAARQHRVLGRGGPADRAAADRAAAHRPPPTAPPPQGLGAPGAPPAASGSRAL